MPSFISYGYRPRHDWRAEERKLTEKRAASWARMKAESDRRVGR